MGKSGDLLRRPKSKMAWRTKLTGCWNDVRLTIVVGQHAQNWHLPSVKRNLTEILLAWRDYDNRMISLPNSSPRNNIWIKNGPWFAESLLPMPRQSVGNAVA